MSRISTIGIIMVMALVLASCGSRGKTVTTDDSADYKSARQLPPLKKPSTVVAASPSVAPPIADGPVVGNDVVTKSTPRAVSAPVSVSSAADISNVSAVIANLKNNIARLTVDSEFDNAWDYLSSKLARSSVTVFLRNKDTGRISIGCGAYEAVQDTKSKDSRWAILNSKSEAKGEYCILLVAAARGGTIVSALDRNGDEVGQAGAKMVFEQILNN